MRRLLLIVAMATLVLAKPKPDSYREKEDFQYSRSSSDDGHKAGFYGAQRGNMGGNYERAHNMDMLAQNQMSGLVRQVDGELGQGANTRTGSVYTAGNSRGIYGSGNYDLSNLKGRNFEEGESFGNSESHSSLTSHNSGYRGHSYSGMNSAGYSSSLAQNSGLHGYQSLGHADQRQTDNLQSIDLSQGHGRYDNDNQAGYNMKYHTQHGSRGQSGFDQSSTNLHSSNSFGADSQSRYITTPVKVVIRPGGRVAIPIKTPNYAVSQNIQTEDKNSINSDAEVLNEQTNINPTSKVKHYESSYSYRKQWEKHHTIPGDKLIVVPTENPFPQNSELYDDAQSLQSSNNQFQNTNLQTASQTSNINSQHAATNSAATRSKFQSGFNTQDSQSVFDTQQSQSGFNSHQSTASADNYANVYGHRAQQSGVRGDLTNAVENINLKPKSYHSSYSYHKSWERQGDPYVIQPVGPISDGQASQRLTASSSNSAAYSSHRSHSSQAHQNYLANCDCDEEGHVRVARSYNTEQDIEQENQNDWQNFNQQTQGRWDKLEDLGQQQQKWDNLQDLGQQTQNMWDGLQQSGQETQNQWDNLQQSGQETQNQWDNLQQLGQQTQNKWDKLEDFGQQTQTGDLEQKQNENVEDFNQHNQNEDIINTNNFEQKQDNKHVNWDQAVGFEQSNTPDIDDLAQHTQSEHKQEDSFKNIHDLELKPQNPVYQSQDTNFDQNFNFDNFMKPQFELKDNHTQSEHKQEDSFKNIHDFESKPQSQDTNFDQNFNFDNFMIPQFEPKDNHTQSEHKQEDSFKNILDLESKPQSQDTNFDQNFNFDNFMIPQFEPKDNPLNFQPHQQESFDININDKPNIFQPSIDPWNQNNNNFWFMNKFNNHNNFEHHSHSHSFSTSQTGNSVQSIWDKIDNIAGEFATEEKEDTNSMSSNSYYHSHNQNVEHNHNVNGWGYTIPTNSMSDLPNSNTNSDNNEHKNDEYHNKFDEETQSTTTVKPEYKPRPIENADVLNNTQQEFSSDNGRGDIGPEEIEITNAEKSHKSPEEIETLSLTKPINNNKVDDIIVQKHLTPQINLDEKSPNTLITTLPSHTFTTVPSVQISTTVKSTSIGTVNQKPTSEMNNLNSESDLQKHRLQEQTSSEIQQHIQQQFIDPTNDFTQELQSFWSSTNVQEQVYNQQNLEQQLQIFHQDEDSKPKEISEDIETLNLSKKPHTVRLENTSQMNSMKNNNEVNNVPLINLSDQETPQENGLYLEPQASATTPKIMKINLPNVQNHKVQEDETVEIPEEVQQQTLEQQFEDFGQQVQSAWDPSDTMQNGFDQQNLEQQFEVFHQQENMQEQNPILDFGQHTQSLQPFEDVQGNLQQNQDVAHPKLLSHFDQQPQPVLNTKDTIISTEQQVQPEETIFKQKVISENNKYLEHSENSELNPKPSDKPAPSTKETSTEVPGFWKSVGSKLSNAKDKVVSWFKRS